MPLVQEWWNMRKEENDVPGDDDTLVDKVTGKFVNPERAIKYFTECIELMPGRVNTFALRGVAYYELGQYEQAISDFDEAIPQKAGLITTCYFHRGLAYLKLGKNLGAIEDFNELIRLKPDDAQNYYNRGIAYNGLGQHLRAIENFNEAIHLKPDYVNAYINRGMNHFIIGSIELGCQDAQKACELGDCILIEWAQLKGYA